MAYYGYNYKQAQLKGALIDYLGKNHFTQHMVDQFVEMFQELYDDVDGLSSSCHNGSSKKKLGNKKRERVIGHAKLKRAYFTPPPTLSS